MTRDLATAARELLVENTQSGEKGGRRFTFTVPSRGLHPFQWFWDSCFHAIVWTHIDPERAREELRALLAWQEADGFIPHVVFWNPAPVRRAPWHWHYLESRFPRLVHPWTPKPQTSVLIQPPVLVQAAERVVAVAPEFLEEALPALERYCRWLSVARDADDDGLISIITQFESGLDYSSAYDESVGAVGVSPLMLELRTRWPELENKLFFGHDLGRILGHSRYQQEDVLVSSTYADGLGALARLARMGDRADVADWAESMRKRVVQGLLAKCWDEEVGLFWNLYGPHERRNSIRTVVSLTPLLLEELPAPIVSRLVEHLTQAEEFWTPWPVASVARSEPSFVPGIVERQGRRLTWRGPLSMSTNWLLVQGLRRHGYEDVADAIAARSRELVARSGFSEFYDPLTGRALGAERFSWATLVVDM
jgi:hypothetical protein